MAESLNSHESIVIDEQHLAREDSSMVRGEMDPSDMIDDDTGFDESDERKDLVDVGGILSHEQVSRQVDTAGRSKMLASVSESAGSREWMVDDNVAFRRFKEEIDESLGRNKKSKRVCEHVPWDDLRVRRVLEEVSRRHGGVESKLAYFERETGYKVHRATLYRRLKKENRYLGVSWNMAGPSSYRGVVPMGKQRRNFMDHDYAVPRTKGRTYMDVVTVPDRPEEVILDSDGFLCHESLSTSDDEAILETIPWDDKKVKDAVKTINEVCKTMPAKIAFFEKLTGLKIRRSSLQSADKSKMVYEDTLRSQRRVKNLNVSFAPGSDGTMIADLQDSNRYPSRSRFLDDLQSDLTHLQEPKEFFFTLTARGRRCLAVHDPSDGVRVYRKVNTSRIGDTEYFRCAKCDYLKSKDGSLENRAVPRVVMRHGIVEGPVNMPHFEGCRALSRVEAAIQNIDRKCRNDVYRGALTPRQSWSQGQTVASFYGMGDHFPPWKVCRNSYRAIVRHTRKPMTTTTMQMEPQYFEDDEEEDIIDNP